MKSYKWARVNRNSLAQFMRTRMRHVHVSVPLQIVQVPNSDRFETAEVRPGKTYAVGNNARKREKQAARKLRLAA